MHVRMCVLSRFCFVFLDTDGGFRRMYEEFFEDTHEADGAVADAVRELREAVEAAALSDRMPWEVVTAADASSIVAPMVEEEPLPGLWLW